METLGTPFIKNKSRVKVPSGIPNKSETLLYLGCFTTVKTPVYAENLIRYLLDKKIDFTLLDEEICCGYPILCNGAINTYNKFMVTLDKLKVGDKVKIIGFKKGLPAYRNKLLAMGLTIGTELKLIRIAPLGDPIEISVRDFSLVLRKNEAAILKLERIIP